jgi:PhnB protein
MATYAGTPLEGMVGPEWRQKISHATLVVGDQVIMGCDPPPDRFEKPQGFSVALGVASTAEAERVFNALAEKGTVTMPLQKTYWSPSFGTLVDQFGIPWVVNCESGG